MHQVFGIRHHGSGSARSLREALSIMQPDKILIEGPSDASDLIDYVAHEDLQPPVALLVYNPKDLTQATYYPFAQFSPEWQAMKYALANEIPVQFMDLPQAIHFGLNLAEKENPQLDFDNKKRPLPPVHHDPLGYMARIAGYEDSERWWEATFEKSDGHHTIFPLILEMMTTLRMELTIEESPREKLREAFMRSEILKATKEGFKNIAVICGAWHSPVLQDLQQFKPNIDKALIKGKNKIKTKATWVPWTYDRLARQSGYRAGVISPAWYDLLFTNRKEVVTRWMTQVARLMREADFPASSAHVIEAVRLSETLSALRDLSIPGIDELFEAATTVFGEGNQARLDLIKQKLIVGDVIGRVPDEIPIVPLQQDLDKCIKAARLSKERNTTESVEKKLDLRKPTNLAASHLLHRLNILTINWGKQIEKSKFDTGSFSETWKLKWLPDFAIWIIEAGMWGNTVHSASSTFIQKKAEEATSLQQLTNLIEAALKADLKKTIPFLVQKLKDISAITKDVHHLMDALPGQCTTIW